LEISESKTRIVKFGRKELQQSIKEKRKTKSFNFLGFTHYMARSRYGRLIMGHKTSKISLGGKLKEIGEWLKTVRSRNRLKDWWQILKAKLTGHYNYFGISGNYRWISKFHWYTTKLTFKWINRRSQKKSMTWKQFVHYKQVNPLPIPKIRFSLYT
jgi:Group II intron, maturase-specific domain.